MGEVRDGVLEVAYASSHISKRSATAYPNDMRELSHVRMRDVGPNVDRPTNKVRIVHE